ALLALRHLAPGETRLRRGLVALVDMGGGTTDVSIARVDESGVTIRATAGEPYLGGGGVRGRLAAGVPIRLPAPRAAWPGAAGTHTGRRRAGALALLRAADDALATLSASDTADLLLDHGGGFGRDLWTTVGRAEFETWIAPDLIGLASLCGRALRLAGRRAEEIDAVALAGGC